MKKIFFPGVLLALLFIFSCSKDEFTEEDAVQAQMDLISHQDSIQEVRDSLEMVGGILQFSVSVIPVDGSVGMTNTYKSADAAEMLSGATVAVSQHGQLLTATTDESGIAVFTDLRVGELNVSVRADGYTSNKFIAYVGIDSYDRGDAWNLTGVLRHAAVMVPVFNLSEGTSNISGVVTYETDLTNEVPESAAGVNVTARIDVNDSDFKSKYMPGSGCTTCDYAATIKQMAITELTASAITDGDGAYSIDIPSAADGLPIVLEVDEVVADQDILLNTLYGEDVWGVQTVRTLFGTNVNGENPLIGYDSYGDPIYGVGIEPSIIPDVPSAYVTFSEPTGTSTQQPLADAEAYAVVGESGIASIIILDQGEGYTQPPKLVITGDGEGAEAVAYISEGKVTSVEITNAGKGYTEAFVAVESFVEVEAVATPKVEYGIQKINLVAPNFGGDGYTSTPDIVISSSSGSGASAEAKMTGYIDTIIVTNMGSGYVCDPIVLVERGSGTVATATPNMTKFNPLYGIILDQDFMDDPANWYETVPTVEIVTTSTGSGATAVVQLGETGTIDEIILSNVGSGYVEAPSVIISSADKGTGAVAWAEIDPATGEITGIFVEDGGKGYKADETTVQISNPPAGGTAPVVDRVVVLKPITGITLTNPGSGYDIEYDITPDDADGDFYDDEPSVELNDVTIDDFVTVLPDMKVKSISSTAGSGYDVKPAITITPSCGYGSGASAEATILLKVESIAVTNPGSGYVDYQDIKVVVVTPPEGCDTQADAAVPTDGLGGGVLMSVTVDTAGMGYLGAPKAVLLDGSDNEVAVLNVAVSNGSVISITSDEVEGLDIDTYKVEFSTFDAPASFNNKANPQSGKLSFVEIWNGGMGYTTIPQIKFHRVKSWSDDNNNDVVDAGDVYELYEDGDGLFIPAEAEVVLTDGVVSEINITNPGTGYYFPPVVEVFVPNDIETAKGTVEISEDGSGFIVGVNFDGPNDTEGAGYASAPTVTFTASVPGMGSGATGTAIVEDGSITKVVITNYGSGYLGKNTPGTAKNASVKLGDANFDVYAGKAYVRDIYLGTGLRNEDYDN